MMMAIALAQETEVEDSGEVNDLTPEVSEEQQNIVPTILIVCAILAVVIGVVKTIADRKATDDEDKAEEGGEDEELDNYYKIK